MRIVGTVTRVILTRGFGFIMGDDGVERFMHAGQVHPSEEWEKMREGRRVSFVHLDTPKGFRAGEIQPC